MTQTTLVFPESTFDLSWAEGDLDDIDDGTDYGRVSNDALDSNYIDLSSLGIVGTVDGTKIEALAVDTGHLAAGAVTSGKIDTGAVTTAKLYAGAVTAEKMTVYTVLCHNPGFSNSSGTVSWNAFDLYFQGTEYNIASGSTSTKYIWWDVGSSSLTYSDTKPDVKSDQTIHMLAINGGGDDVYEVWIPTIMHGGHIITRSISATELVADFVIGDVEIKTDVDVVWTASSGTQGIIITDLGIRGKDSSGNVMFEALTSDGKIVAGAGDVILDSSGITLQAQNLLRFYVSTSQTGFIYAYDPGGAQNHRLMIWTTTGKDLRIDVGANINILTGGASGNIFSNDVTVNGLLDAVGEFKIPSGAPTSPATGHVWMV